MIRGNSVAGGYSADAATHAGGIEVTHATETRVERNAVHDYHAGIRLDTVSDSEVRANRIRNTTGTTFPAGIVGYELTDTTVRPGPTDGYSTPVTID